MTTDISSSISSELTMKQRLFVEEYLISYNATQAYKKAGYTVKDDNVAGVEGHRLLSNPKIKKYIQEVANELYKERRASQEEIIAFMSNTMRNPEARTSERLKSAELLLKSYGVFKDHQIEVSSSNVQVDVKMLEDVVRKVAPEVKARFRNSTNKDEILEKRKKWGI